MTTDERMAEASREAVRVSADGPVGVVTLDRAASGNPLTWAVLEDVAAALEGFDRDRAVRCMVVAGGAEAFSTGLEPRELRPELPRDPAGDRRLESWDRLRRVSKPLVAAVSGRALGAGCELALACDIVVASETASFGLPGTGPGSAPCGGATQLLTRAVGKALAMDLLLTGRCLGAREALSHGLVSRLVPVESFMEEALQLARDIAWRDPSAVALVKDGVLRSFDAGLEAGLAYERRLFRLSLASGDPGEGRAG